jgi:uncharacterized protein YjbI with pentapeptide repeats
MPWWVAAGVGIIVAIATALWWWLPKWQVNSLRLQIRDPKARADVEDNFRKSIGQLLGGAVVLIGAGFAYYQTQLTSKASRDQVISQQVSKGFEQLGSDKIVVRLGGIYALEGVMNISGQYHQPVLEALCAFVRDGTKIDTAPGSPATDIQASLTVIGRRAAGTGNVDLTGAHIPKANLLEADLTGANLTGVNLTGADLTRVRLTRADLTHADLRGARLTGADLTSAYLTGADLTGADLTHARLTGTDLFNADLTHADLTGADLTGANLGARLAGAHLNGAHLNGADLTDADLTGADLTGADLTHANLTGADVLQSQLNKACGGGAGASLPSGLTLKPCP